MEKNYRICKYCSEKHCCRGLCKEMNEFLIKSTNNRTVKMLKFNHRNR
jgi:hypothetical protein